MNDEYDFWQLFPLVHKIGCYPTIYYDCKYDAQKKDYGITIHSVDGLTFVAFENSLQAEIDKNITLVQSKISDVSGNEAKEMITELKRGARQCRRSIKEQRVGNSVFEYFSHASFDDGKGNRNYEDMIKDSTFLNSLKATSSRINATDLEKFDQLLLHIHTVHFTRVFINVLDYLDEKIDDINISLKITPLLPKDGLGKYELMLNKNYSSKELTYLFNLLSRMRFFEIRDGDYENLYRLIADLYKSQRGPNANKAKSVKNDWTNSVGHKMDESFLKNFKEKILKELTVLVQEDIARGYDPKRMTKLSKTE